MMMNYSKNTMSVIILCSYLGIEKGDSLKPFSLGEWNLFLDDITKVKQEPSIVFSGDSSWKEKLHYSDEQLERINGLISRGARAAFELDSLEKKGIKVVTLFDSDYPVLLRRKLKKKTPPLLFYAGNLELAKKIGIAVVGSRNADDECIVFTKRLVEKASREKLIVYSGGARGIDSISETTALNSGSAVVSFVADSLLSKIKKPETIKSIMEGRLLLFSDVKPDAGFSAARAMNRNKYIYASAYGAFVIESDYNKGGTWNGALESIRNDYTKTLIWNNKRYCGNQKLIENGGTAFEITEESIYSVITKKQENFEQIDLFGSYVCADNSERASELDGDGKQRNKDDIYDMVKMLLVEYVGVGKRLEEISGNFNIVEQQMSIWLDCLCHDRLVVCEEGVYKKI